MITATGMADFLGSMELDDWCALMELNPAWVDELAAAAAREECAWPPSAPPTGLTDEAPADDDGEQLELFS